MAPDEARFVDAVVASAGWLAGKLERSAETVRAADGDPVDATDLFLKRFVDAFEAGKRLFRAGLLVEELPQDNLTYIDMLQLAERHGVLRSSLTWREIGRVRNRVVHEYAMDRAAAAEAVNAALVLTEDLLTLLRASTARIRERRIVVGAQA